MKIRDVVWIRIGIDRRLIRGVIEAAEFAGGWAIVRVGFGKSERRYERVLKRIYADGPVIRKRHAAEVARNKARDEGIARRAAARRRMRGLKLVGVQETG